MALNMVPFIALPETAVFTGSGGGITVFSSDDDEPPQVVKPKAKVIAKAVFERLFIITPCIVYFVFYLVVYTLTTSRCSFRSNLENQIKYRNAGLLF